MLTHERVAAYQASRDKDAHRGVLCHAPFLSLNFEQTGRVTSCCYNRRFVLGSYPQQLLSEIWAGAAARTLREAFLTNAEAPGCDLCFHQLESGNFSGTLMRNFDGYSTAAGYAPELTSDAPRVLEFEISNACNLECVMCSGNWSSAIRARREKLPPLRSPYDRAFVRQLEAFLPAIVAAKFLGGEPFLIERYYEIWERFRELNPGARLSITTNGSVLPARARELLEGLRANIVVSLDGITAATYEAVRKNARFDDVMENLEYFIAYAGRRGTYVSLAVCPMTHNWRELPRLFELCQERKLEIYLNTVVRPLESSLAALPPGELAEVISHLEQRGPRAGATATILAQWNGLLNQLRSWHDEKRQFERRCLELETRVRTLSGAGSRGGVARLPAGAERMLSPLSLAFRVEHERMTAPHPDLRNLLPASPLGLWNEADAPTARDVLLAAHLLCRELDGFGGSSAREDAILKERGQLERYLEWLAAQARGDRRPLEELGAWLRERMRQGEGGAIVGWVRILLGALEEDLASALDFAEELPRRLALGLDRLRSQGLDATGCDKVSDYFAALVTGQLTKLRWPSAGSNREGASGPTLRPPPIRSLDDLSRFMDAAHLFYSYTRPTQDQDVFRRRLDACLAQLSSSGQAGAACQMLERSDVTTAYWYLENASDDWLARAIGSLASQAG